jgi:tRNA(Ser,Leu) C12 N-acetylase TAN1
LNTRGALILHGGQEVCAFNLLVSFHQNVRASAEEEVRQRLKDVGAVVERVEQWAHEGVLLVEASRDSKRMVMELRIMCRERPELFQHTHHWVPIERWVPSTDEAMKAAVKEVAQGIAAKDKWMLHLHKRHYTKHHDDLVKLLTDPIETGIVDLRMPEKIVAVEILGDQVGMALLSRDELLDVNRVREEGGLLLTV